MKITFFGTSHGHPSKTRNSSSVLLTVGEELYLVDVGAPATELFFQKELSFQALKGVFMTHCHSDHCAGALFLLSTVGSHVFSTCDTEFYFPDERFTNLFEEFRRIESGKTEFNVSCHTYQTGTFFDNGRVRVTAYPNRHLESIHGKSNSFLVEAEGKAVLFTGDMHRELNDFPKVAAERHLDCIVTECAHFPIEALQEKINQTDADRVIVTHVYPDQKFPALQTMKDAHGNPVAIANDFDEFII